MNKLSLLACAASTLLTSPAYAEPSQAVMVAAMKRVGAAWGTLARTREPLIVSCSEGGFQAKRFTPGSTVQFDLRKTDSLMNPYVGVVELTGQFEENSSQQDGSCSPTVEAARSNPVYRPVAMIYHMQLYYQFDAGKWSFSQGNVVFMNQLGNDLPGAQAPSTIWEAAVGL